jgi:hypothetical protein
LLIDDASGLPPNLWKSAGQREIYDGAIIDDGILRCIQDNDAAEKIFIQGSEFRPAVAEMNSLGQDSLFHQTIYDGFYDSKDHF